MTLNEFEQITMALEAMEMQNELRLLRLEAVKEIRVKEDDKVDQGQMLLVLK